MAGRAPWWKNWLRENRVAYAINTGVGKLSDVHIPPEQNRQLQVNLIRSHSAGVGEPLSVEETRAMMLLRANSLAKGFSGVRPVVIDTDLRDAEPRRASGGAIAGKRGREWRPCATGAPGAGA